MTRKEAVLVADRKKQTKPEAGARFLVFPDGSEAEIVREDGKYFYTAQSQFRRARWAGTVTVKEKTADEETD